MIDIRILALGAMALLLAAFSPTHEGQVRKESRAIAQTIQSSPSAPVSIAR